ncbi:MAG: hypothetical protein OWQ51_05860 [Pyrobaculum arsenaticum]|uniref:Cytochrome c maturation protein CcmE n=3 Tax=Pyrobaculum TaxID=2276 RepID=A4WJE5_PYRAR|nr:hypothetical protein [Pyrobaculum arsenaticum]ABP50512.1 hypothetical protein Pars_0932 [Pyrobaculum arsenaticum DSM 13514]AFA39463.1 hypothetical protein Pogu_1436 [Pyrobaculum oguniense TE7]MCY0890488.1 hypothetical protein [Pyrobaculum arsenaticum]NYR14564.1 hypothetical protein [Pyrobaculum arsenaticum]
MKRWVFAAALISIFLVAGVMSLYIGTPMDVSDLKNFKGGKVRVSGKLVDYGRAGDNLYLILRGRDGFTITALIPYQEVLKVAGPSFQFSDEVVVEGVYNPANKTLYITTILKGCHSAYYAPVKS